MYVSEPWENPKPRKFNRLFLIIGIALALALGYILGNNSPFETQPSADESVMIEDTSVPETTEYVNPYAQKDELKKAIETAARVDASLGPDAYQGTNWLLLESGYSEDELFKTVKPISGSVFQEIYLDEVAPLEIQTVGSGGYYFVLDPISLTYKSSGNAARDQWNQQWLNDPEAFERRCICFYADAGDLVKMEIPLGEYEIYFASGEHWYCEEYLFGIETQYAKCSGTFLFEETESGYAGCKIQLQSVVDGNLETYTIDKESFPKVSNDRG